MYQTIPISEFQKAPAKAFKSTKGFQYVLSNNKKVGMIITGAVMDYLENTGLLETIEDHILSQNSTEIQEAEQEVQEAMENKDFSKFVSIDRL
jgi:DNA polymerase II large subunit